MKLDHFGLEFSLLVSLAGKSRDHESAYSQHLSLQHLPDIVCRRRR